MEINRLEATKPVVHKNTIRKLTGKFRKIVMKWANVNYDGDMIEHSKKKGIESKDTSQENYEHDWLKKLRSE